MTDFEKSRIVAHGPSTRPVQIDGGGLVSFAPEALHDIVRQARENFIAMNVEHLNMLPPIGRWSDGEVKTMDDGEQQVMLFGEVLDQFTASADLDDPFQSGDLGGDAPARLDVKLQVESRNFDAGVWDEAQAECPLPVEPVHKWSSLPPVEWLLSIPVAWGAVKFLGSFFERMGQGAADGLLDWIKSTSRKAREPERDRYVTVSFDLPDRRIVYGFIPFAADDEELAAVRNALDSAGTLAEVAGRMNDGLATEAHLVAYLFDGTKWRLAWFVTDAGAFRTKYFTENLPDPEKFLGRPLLDGMLTPDTNE